MSANTLYDVLKPITFLINLYGVKMRHEKSFRRVTKGLQLLLCLNLNVCFILYLAAFGGARNHLSTYRFRIKLAACTLCFVYLNWSTRRLKHLLTALKTVEKSPQNEKAFRKVRRVLFFAFSVVFLDNLYQCIPFMKDILPDVKHYFSVFLFLATIFGPLLTYLITLLPCVIITFFICLVVYYVSLSFDGPMEELKRCESPLRRTKMTTDLIKHFYQTNKLTKLTDTFGNPLLFILKITAIYQFFMMVYLWEDKSKLLIGDNLSIYPTLIYLWLLRTAPSANSKLSQLYTTLRESVMEDDQWLSRDPTLRPHLLRLRLSQLEQLTHLSLGQAQFTILNEPVGEEDVFLFFVEMIDTWNTIHTTKS